MQDSNLNIQTQQPVQKTDKKYMIVLIVLLFIIIAGITAIIVILLIHPTGDSTGDSAGNNGTSTEHIALTPEYLRSYCNEKELTIYEYGAETYGEDRNEELTIVCQEDIMGQGEWITGVTSADDLPGYKNDIFLIHYAKYKKPLSEVPEMQFGYLNVASKFHLLAESENYKKFYEEKNDIAYSGGASYVVFDDDVYFDISAKNNKSVREFLIGAGYPDDNWGLDEGEANSNTDSPSQRDLLRRDDLVKAAGSLVYYQTNNRGMPPEGPSYWKGSSTFNCGDGDVACSFVDGYLSSYGSTNTFKDPSGEYYSLFITDNLAKGDITTSYGSNKSKLVEDGSGYIIGGDSPFSEYVIYIIPGATCEGNTAIKSASERSAALLYQLEENSTYCINNVWYENKE